MCSVTSSVPRSLACSPAGVGLTWGSFHTNPLERWRLRPRGKPSLGRQRPRIHTRAVKRSDRAAEGKAYGLMKVGGSTRAERRSRWLYVGVKKGSNGHVASGPSRVRAEEPLGKAMLPLGQSKS